jgi:hypothetical protein
MVKYEMDEEKDQPQENDEDRVEGEAEPVVKRLRRWIPPRR